VPSRITLDIDDADAGRAASHPKPPPIRVFAAPSSPGSPVRFNTIEPGLFSIACWRMDDARFDFDSSFIRPEAKKEFGLLAAIAKNQPGSPLSVFGHADPSGNDDYNKVLSGRRAIAVHSMLIRDPDRWEELFTQPFKGDQWTSQQLRLILETLPSAAGAPFADPDASPPISTAAAVTQFQRENGLAVDGKAGPDTRRKMFLAYMDFLCDGNALRLKPSDFLGGGADPGGKGDLQGCSEFNPILVFSRAEAKRFEAPALKSERDADNQVNRRVVIFFFDKGVRVDESSWPCPRVKEGVAGCKARFWSDGEKRRNPQDVRRQYQNSADTFACRFYDRLAMKSPCEAAVQLTTFDVRLVDFAKEPIPGAPFRILQGAGVRRGHAGDDAFITVQALKRPDKLTIEWTLPDQEDDEVYPFSREFIVDVGTDDASDDKRLFNLGYLKSKREANVRAYQRDFNHPVTGKIEDIRDELRKFHDGGERPKGGKT
jgi:hypothetical protein